MFLCVPVNFYSVDRFFILLLIQMQVSAVCCAADKILISCLVDYEVIDNKRGPWLERAHE